MNELFASHAEKVLLAIKENNKQARKRNRLAKRAYRQSVLNYEQAERQYLLEKSRLQPSFRLTATEFLACKPDFMNDPEQAGEAKYLADLGVKIDERVLRLTFGVKGDAEYMRPSLVIKKLDKAAADDKVYAMSELLYFATFNNIEINQEALCFFAYLVYRDRTTLPVVHKYRLTQEPDSALRRWEVAHLDTAYATSHKASLRLDSAHGCAALFVDRDEV